MYRIHVEPRVIEGVQMWVGTSWWDTLRISEVWAKTPPRVLRLLASTMASHTLTTPARKKGNRA